MGWKRRGVNGAGERDAGGMGGRKKKRTVGLGRERMAGAKWGGKNKRLKGWVGQKRGWDCAERRCWQERKAGGWFVAERALGAVWGWQRDCLEWIGNGKGCRLLVGWGRGGRVGE